ncbi:unnamed protein product [Ilex paraguariensis]|uniref:Uncharacterized protein n=1 Tax=Ilex paraguariensis TaxID=185542 RepID=A0ABC8T9X7_9AQUA
MKNRGAGYLKQVMALLVSAAKNKTVAVKSKTRAIKARLIIFSLLRDKKVLLGPISNKLHACLLSVSQSQDHTYKQQHWSAVEACGDQSNSILLYNKKNATATAATNIQQFHFHTEEDLVDQKAEAQQEHLLHRWMYEEEEEENDEMEGSVIDQLVRNSKEKEGEEYFKLEEEEEEEIDIDLVADLFIKRFHRQMRMQKQHCSFKNYQEGGHDAAKPLTCQFIHPQN